MADSKWGKCKGCRFFDSHSASAEDDTGVAKCTQPELADFDLKVSDDSGCNAFEARVGIYNPAPMDDAGHAMH